MKGGYQENVGNWIRNERAELNLTQAQLAEQMGVSDATISNWELAKHALPAQAHADMTYLFKLRRRAMHLVGKVTA